MTVLAVATLVTGCGGGGSPAPVLTTSPDPPGPGLHELTLISGGEERDYLLEVPESYRPGEPSPLIVVLHPGLGSARKVRSSSGMAELAQEHGVLVAYPLSVDQFWRPALEGEHGVGVAFGTDPVDVDFLRELVAHLVAEWGVAPERVYAAGHSNGAAMAYRLAAEAGDVFAAVAPVGGYLFDPPPSIEPAAPVSVIGFVGMDSEYTGEIAAGLGIWRDRLGCPPGEPTALPDDDRVTQIQATCRDGSEVLEYRIEGMGHVWPKPSHGIDATRTMWAFFTAHTRNRYAD